MAFLTSARGIMSSQRLLWGKKAAEKSKIVERKGDFDIILGCEVSSEP